MNGGDCNGDGAIDITDATCILNYLFGGGTPPVSVAFVAQDTDPAVRFLSNADGTFTDSDTNLMWSGYLHQDYSFHAGLNCDVYSGGFIDINNLSGTLAIYNIPDYGDWRTATREEFLQIVPMTLELRFSGNAYRENYVTDASFSHPLLESIFDNSMPELDQVWPNRCPRTNPLVDGDMLSSERIHFIEGYDPVSGVPLGGFLQFPTGRIWGGGGVSGWAQSSEELLKNAYNSAYTTMPSNGFLLVRVAN
jgi:hypothetical protein